MSALLAARVALVLAALFFAFAATANTGPGPLYPDSTKRAEGCLALIAVALAFTAGGLQ